MFIRGGAGEARRWRLPEVRREEQADRGAAERGQQQGGRVSHCGSGKSQERGEGVVTFGDPGQGARHRRSCKRGCCSARIEAPGVDQPHDAHDDADMVAIGVLGSASAILLLPAFTSAQAIFNVTSLTGIQAAITAASPGDIILLAPSTANPPFYSPFTLNKGVTIVGNGQIIGTMQGPVPVTINVPPGEVAHLTDLLFIAQPGSLGVNYGTKVVVSGGVAIFDSCTFSTSGGEALNILGAKVVVSASTITASGIGGSGVAPALKATAADVTLLDCQVTGPNTACPPIGSCSNNWVPPLPAARFTNSTLHAERTTFRGGSHTYGFIPAFVGGANALEASGSTWLTSCTLIGGSTSQSAPVTGGAALVISGTTAADLRTTTLTPGTPNGVASVGPVNPSAPLLSLALAPRWTRGQTSTLTMAGDPNALFGLIVTPASNALLIAPVVEPVWVTGAITVLAGSLDAQGIATLAVAVPNTPALQFAPVWCQAVGGSALPLRASTLAGGVVR